MITITLEIDSRTLSKERSETWRDESRRVSMVANAFLTTWELSHEQAGSRDQLAAWLTALREWHRAPKATRGQKPVCPVAFDTQTLRQQLYAAAKRAGQKLNVRIVTLLLNRLRSTLTTTSEGLPTWIAALLHRTRLPRFTRGLPVSVDGKLAVLEIREVERDGRPVRELWLKLRLDRVVSEGRRLASSTQDEVRLYAGGKITRYAAPIWRLAESGARPGAISVRWVEHKRKWFVAFAVEPEPVEQPRVDPDKTAIIYASQRRPLLLRVAGRTRPLTGAGQHVTMMRARLQKQRRSRQENYRTSMTPNGRGHGRTRALEPWEGKFARAWRSFQKLNNSEWTRSAIERAVAAGCGRILYIQPTGGDRFLDVAGQCEPNGTGWEWFQFGTMLRDKCARLGVTVEIVKDSAARRRARRFAASDVAADAV